MQRSECGNEAEKRRTDSEDELQEQQADSDQSALQGPGGALGAGSGAQSPGRGGVSSVGSLGLKTS